MIRVNLRSVYGVIHSAVPQMIRQSGESIIAVSSKAAQRAAPFRSRYAASEGAIISLVKSLFTELARNRILVNCVAPGWIATHMSAPALKAKAAEKKVPATIPLERIGTPGEIAGPILSAVSDLASFMTGEIINVNGGSFPCG